MTRLHSLDGGCEAVIMLGQTEVGLLDLLDDVLLRLLGVGDGAEMNHFEGFVY